MLLMVFSYIEFTNIMCTSLDKDFADFEYCYLKSVNRSFKYMSLRLKLYKVPLTNITIQYQVLKKANGYKPFMYNITFDVCKFLKSPNHPVTKIFYSLFRNRSNVNHTCPYNHDFIVDKLDSAVLNEKTSRLPIPDGDYAVYITCFAYNIKRISVKVYIKVFYKNVP
ncbi:uncharacterized protein LOC119681878 [Teleopsis dalmanni]|uniref:uncharacterized protein LOC119681878 n=1 Tax=Teleopsis dalmanni TaxID=139649 RepID=UPI0018CCEB1E|nr:uncharacterized protein LOC119681878 [Teleopsis dalmanni]